VWIYITSARFEPVNPESNDKHTNHYTTDTTFSYVTLNIMDKVRITKEILGIRIAMDASTPVEHHSDFDDELTDKKANFQETRTAWI
jgi:hypothetical protein